MTTLQLITSIVLIAGLLGCNQQPETTPNRPGKAIQIDTTRTIQKPDITKYYTTKDTLLIAVVSGDTLKYSKGEFNQIVDNFPALYKDLIQDPDLTYFGNDIWKDIVDENGNQVHLTFGSEVGQDNYYILYAYFLKQKNGVDKYVERRKKLIDIYSNINALFGHFEYGGTYFGHQCSRILGYAEYSVYLYSQSKDDIRKTYDIVKQKDLYIKSLRQLIEDESEIDNEALGKKKTARAKELNKIVDDLEKLITDNFYLRRAQEFHYRHYEYY